MKGKIVTLDTDNYALQVFIVFGWTWEAGTNGIRRWKTIEEVEEYAEKNGIELIKED